jgi:integrase
VPKLTAGFVEHVKPDPEKRTEIPDSVVVGLYVVLQSSGHRSWAVRYRHQGRPRKLTIGPYPRVSLAEARERAREALEQVGRGVDPGAINAARRGAKSFEQVVELFIERYAKVHQRSWRNTQQQLAKHALPEWGRREFSSITRADVNELLYRVAERAPSASNHLLGHLRTLWAWAVDEGLCEHSACERVRQKAPSSKRDRTLSDDEIRIVWRAWTTQNWPAGPFQQMLLILGQRRSETAAMRWSEIDLTTRVWTIPAERMKSDRAHLVPLSTMAMEIIEQLPRFSNGEYLFPAYPRRRASSDPRAWAAAPLSGYGEIKRRCNGLIAAAGHELPGWTLHDLRRTVRTNLSRLRVPDHVSELVIGHKIQGLRAVYDIWAYVDERREALERWSDLLHDIIDPDRKIIRLRG